MSDSETRPTLDSLTASSVPTAMRLPEAGSYYGYSRATSYRLAAENKFPVPVYGSKGQFKYVRGIDVLRDLAAE